MSPHASLRHVHALLYFDIAYTYTQGEDAEERANALKGYVCPDLGNERVRYPMLDVLSQLMDQGVSNKGGLCKVYVH